MEGRIRAGSDDPEAPSGGSDASSASGGIMTKRYRIVTDGTIYRLEEGRRLLFWTFWRRPAAWVGTLEEVQGLKKHAEQRAQEGDRKWTEVRGDVTELRPLSQRELMNEPMQVATPELRTYVRKPDRIREALKAQFIHKYYHTAYASIQGPPHLAEAEFKRDVDILVAELT
jgi:hypothetical protein